MDFNLHAISHSGGTVDSENKKLSNQCSFCSVGLDGPNPDCTNAKSHRSATPAQTASAEPPKETVINSALAQPAEIMRQETSTNTEAEKPERSPRPAMPSQAPSIGSLLQSLVKSLGLLLRSPLIWLVVQLESLAAAESNKEGEKKKDVDSERDGWSKNNIVIGLILLVFASMFLGPYLRKWLPIASVIPGLPAETPETASHSREIINDIKLVDEQALIAGATALFRLEPKKGVKLENLSCTYAPDPNDTNNISVTNLEGCIAKVTINKYQPKFRINLAVEDELGKKDKRFQSFDVKESISNNVITEIRIISPAIVAKGKEIKLEARFFDPAIKSTYTCKWWSSIDRHHEEPDCFLTLYTNDLPPSAEKEGVKVQVRLIGRHEEILAMKERVITFQSLNAKPTIKPSADPAPHPTPTPPITPAPAKPEEQSKPPTQSQLPKSNY